jgi:hypothetical protein
MRIKKWDTMYPIFFFDNGCSAILSKYPVVSETIVKVIRYRSCDV